MAEGFNSDNGSHVSPGSRPFIQCNGRTYLSDPTLPYPLPVDLSELHRQNLRTLLLMQIYGGPLASPEPALKQPQRVLEVGCGSGFWSMVCHEHFKARGFDNVEFVGLDIAQLSADNPSLFGSAADMKWTFVRHDLRIPPWPFADGEFDLVISKDMALVLPLAIHPHYMDENLRVLKRGGTIEVWETDHMVRRLRPHPSSAASASPAETEPQESASNLGVHIVNMNTPLAPPRNAFLVEYNDWLGRVVTARELMANPCTGIKHYLLQEAELLTGVGSQRVAIPLSETRWEREGIYVPETTSRDGRLRERSQTGHLPQGRVEKDTLTAGQAALRRTALLTLVQEMQALELSLRKVNGMNQDEWDLWASKMALDLTEKVGSFSGECLEAGVWWAKKK